MYYSEININILSSLFAFISTELEILFAHFFFLKFLFHVISLLIPMMFTSVFRVGDYRNFTL